MGWPGQAGERDPGVRVSAEGGIEEILGQWAFVGGSGGRGGEFRGVGASR